MKEVRVINASEGCECVRICNDCRDITCAVSVRDISVGKRSISVARQIQRLKTHIWNQEVEKNAG